MSIFILAFSHSEPSLGKVVWYRNFQRQKQFSLSTLSTQRVMSFFIASHHEDVMVGMFCVVTQSIAYVIVHTGGENFMHSCGDSGVTRIFFTEARTSFR